MINGGPWTLFSQTIYHRTFLHLTRISASPECGRVRAAPRAGGCINKTYYREKRYRSQEQTAPWANAQRASVQGGRKKKRKREREPEIDGLKGSRNAEGTVRE